MGDTEEVVTITDIMVMRQAAWAIASELIEPLVETLSVEEYSTGQVLFGHTSKVTPLEQVVDATLQIANWLMGVDV